MTMTCERCKREIFKYEKCDYCGRKICNSCIKSSQRSSKTRRLIICKDCWGSIPKRKSYKNKKAYAPRISVRSA
ncbi:MAG: hypothetical protein QXN59_01515 [Candidatus Micrarchaeaceae archaeon]